jgi:hypothetical protein
MKCCICGGELNEYANNPFPVAGETCCNKCNYNVVIPLRFFYSDIVIDKALVISTNNTVKLIKPKEQYFTLEELQKCVDGYIEIYPTRSKEYMILVNAEGLINGMAFNQLASKIFNIDAYGPVVICPKKIFEKPE